VVVADTFKSIVLDAHKDVFLDVYADWCGPCRHVSPIVCKIAETLQDVDSIVIAKFDCDANDKDAHYLPERTIPILKFFPKSNKEKWIAYNGSRKASDMLKFIHEHSEEKFDLSKKLSKIEREEKLDAVKKEGREKIAAVDEAVEDLCDDEEAAKSHAQMIEEIKKIKQEFIDSLNEKDKKRRRKRRRSGSC